MPTIAKLERLEALVGRLEPLAEKNRGELIEAPHWNALVDSVIEVARSVLAEDKTEVVPEHEHSDQVGLGWLDSKLRGLVLEGGLTDPGEESRLSKLARDMKGISNQLEELELSIGQLKSDLNGISTRDLLRESDMTNVSRKIDGISDARDEVATLRKTLRTLETDVKQAVEFGQTVTRDGELINVAELSTRVEKVEELRAELTTGQGTLFSANEFERRLVELQNTLVTEEELNKVLETVRKQVGDDLRSSVSEETREIASKATGDALTPMRNELLEQINTRFDSMDTTIDTRVADSASDLSANLGNTLRKETDAEIARQVGALKGELTGESQTRFDDFSGKFDETFSTFRNEMDSKIADDIKTQMAAPLKDMEGRLRESESRAADLAGKTDENLASIEANATRIEKTRLELLAADTTARNNVSRQMEALEATIDKNLSSRTEELRQTLTEELTLSLDGQIRDLEGRLTKTSRDAARVESKLLANELRADVNDIIQNQVGVLRTDLETTIEKRFNQNNSRLNGLVTEEVSRATSNLNKRIRNEIEVVEAERRRSSNNTTTTRNTRTTRSTNPR